jgi:hypothetical protein
MRASGLASGLLGVLVLAGCQLLFGDFTVSEPTHAGCTSGAVRCSGSVLQTCDSEGKAWEDRAVCASQTLCDETLGMCQQPACSSGERRCQDAELQLCNATQDGWSNLKMCATASRCSAESGTCTDEPCQPGALQCNGATLQSCNADQSGWSDLPGGPCASAALCDKDAGKCDAPVCNLGDFNCAGAELQTCNATLSGWTTVQSCDSDALCDATNGKCGTGACTNPGEFRCTDAGGLERCADDLTGWLSVATCRSVAHCDSVNGVCTMDPCTPGAYQCNGAMLDMCNADSTAWTLVATCQTDGLCQQTLSAHANTCSTPVCATGDTKCVDVQPEICNADLTGFRANGPACATAELCVDGVCEPPTCNPNDRRCTDAQPEICNPGRTGYVANGAPCASVALCDPSTGTCGDQKCVSGQLRCDPANPTNLQTCNADLTDWDPTPCDICATADLCSASLGATTCDNTSCKEPMCDVGAPSCGGTGTDEGKVLEICNTGRTDYTPCQTCVTPELCTASLATKPFTCTSTSCTQPSCAPSDVWCGGTGNTTLSQCPPSRINTQPTVLDTCVTNGLCVLTQQEVKTTCEAPTCALTDLWCGGTGNTTLYQCPSSRINTQAVALGNCATNGLCELSHQEGKTTCEAPKCAVGATQCSGTGNLTLQMCNSDRTGFTTCDTCATAQLCTDSLVATTCNSSACFACEVGEAHCVAGNYQTCKADRSGFATTDCNGNGCDETMGGCLMPPPPDGGADDAGSDGG